MVICLERDADLHMAQRMPLPLTVFCLTKIQIGFTFLVLLVPAHPGSPGKRAIKRVFVCVCVYWHVSGVHPLPLMFKLLQMSPTTLIGCLQSMSFIAAW